MTQTQSLKEQPNTQINPSSNQYATFLQSGRLFGIPVERVQEIVKTMEMTDVPLSPNFVTGLINLRGQLAAAISLEQLFGINHSQDEKMNVICEIDSNLIAFQVDEIGDVIEVENHTYQKTPENVPPEIKQFISGVYQLPQNLLSVIDIDFIYKYLNKSLTELESAS